MGFAARDEVGRFILRGNREWEANFRSTPIADIPVPLRWANSRLRLGVAQERTFKC